MDLFPFSPYTAGIIGVRGGLIGVRIDVGGLRLWRWRRFIGAGRKGRQPEFVPDIIQAPIASSPAKLCTK